MNQIDITNVNPERCMNVVVVTRRDGIQGPSGEDGVTPHINEETGTWFVGEEDTGVSAGISKDDITLIHIFENETEFPQEGNPKDLYIANNTSTVYRWNTFASKYNIFKPNYINNLEHIIHNMSDSINKSVLKRPEHIIAGSLITIDRDGNTKCTNLSYKSLLDKIESCNKTLEERIPSNLVPGAMLVGTKMGTVKSSDILQSDLLAVVKDSKNYVKFAGKPISGTLVLTDEDGNIKSSGKTFDKLIEDLQNSSVQADWKEQDSKSLAFIKNKPDVVTTNEYLDLLDVVESKIGITNKVIPGMLMFSDETGNISCSNINYKDVVTKEEIAIGSKSEYVTIFNDDTHNVSIPQSIRVYPTINVYHNGNLLMEDLHYYTNGTFISLNGFSAYRNDIFSFVGHGYSSSSLLPSTPSIAGSKSVYVNVLEDEVHKVLIPDAIRIYPAINVYHNGILLIEGVHYSNDSEYITFTGFSAYKNDIFNFVGYGSVSLLPDSGEPDHTHPNMAVLDRITHEKIDAWDTITTHNHDDLYVRKEELFDKPIAPSLLPVANDNNIGAVKSSTGVNKVTVAEDGTMFVTNIDVSILTSTNTESSETGEDYSIVLSSGTSVSYKTTN